MSNLFRRNIISVYRFPDDVAIDSDTWDFLNFDTMTVVLNNIAADIQQKSSLRMVAANLPGDVNRGQLWQIFFNAGQNTVRDRDIIIDMTTPNITPIAKRPIFQVTSAYWTVFQYQCLCELLQT